MNEAMKPLTPRQLQVLRGLCAGLVGKEIAAQMGLGVRTIESHIQGAKRSLGARNIAHATFICGQQDIFHRIGEHGSCRSLLPR